MKIKQHSRYTWWLLFAAITIHVVMIGRALYTMTDLRLASGQFGTEYVKLSRVLDLTDGMRRAEEAIKTHSLHPSGANWSAYCEALRQADNAAAEAAAAGTFSAELESSDLERLRVFLGGHMLRCAVPSLSLQDKKGTQEEFFRFYATASGLRLKLSAHARVQLEENNSLAKAIDQKATRLILSSSAIATFILLLMFWVAYSLRRLNHDITEQRDEILVLKNGIEQSPLGVILTDVSGRIEYVNPAFTAMYGYLPAEVIGRTPSVLKSGETPLPIYHCLWNSLLGGHPWTGQLHNRTSSGALLWVRVYASPVRSSEGKFTHFITLHKDVSLEKQLMADVVAAKHEAEQADRAKSEFLAAMSHEIRTPLNAIVGMSELLDEAGLNKDQAQYLSIMRSASDTLLSLISDILDISKIEAGKVEIEKAPFNLEELVSKVSEMMAVRAFKKDVEINCKIEADVPVYVEGDATRLRQVLMNLMGNAVKFVERGWISLNVKKLKAEGDSIELQFSVRDTGIGIPAGKLASIFEKFTQADPSTTRKYGGTGLGLPISKMLIELMGGKIRVESEPGLGSVFYFTVKLGPQKDKRAVYLPPTDIKELSGRRFLVVDDNLVNRLIIREMMQSWGAFCSDAADAEAGLAKVLEAQRKDAPFHGVFADFNMPGMDGYEFCRRLMADPAIAPKPALALVTSDIVRFRKEDFRALGVNTHIMKPVKKQTVLDGALELLAAGKAVPLTQPLAAPGYTKADLPALSALVVDDSEDNRILIGSFLKGSKVRLDLAVDGFDALEKFKAGAYDIVFMDIQMPGLNGFDATVKLRELEAAGKRGRTRVVALTAMAMREDLDKAIKAGCDDYLSKPIRKNIFYAYLVDFAADRAAGHGA
ncbi:MAG: response regulator [Elusimicrobia bacterium]|nr:response regulator [Elusimicrobiota bacterium]